MVVIKLLEFKENLINADKCITPENDRVYCEDAFDYFFNLIKSDKIESSIIINLDENGNIINYIKYTSNDSEQVDIPYSELFAPSLISKARGVIHIHNHTSQKYECFSLKDILFNKSMCEHLAPYEIRYLASCIVMPDGKVLEYDDKLLNAYYMREVYKESRSGYENFYKGKEKEEGIRRVDKISKINEGGPTGL